MRGFGRAFIGKTSKLSYDVKCTADILDAAVGLLYYDKG